MVFPVIAFLKATTTEKNTKRLCLLIGSQAWQQQVNMKIIASHFIEKLSKIVSVAIPETEEDFKPYYQLRYEVLRKPWNQPKGSETDEYESTSFHFCLLTDKHIVGVARLQLNSPTQAQVRFMAVKIEFQGYGLGELLLNQCHFTTTEKNAKEVFLQARENALNFYKRNGYTLIEKTHLLFGEIQHYSMIKIL